jgi:uncharacterized RDD family membrane protein YckC
MKKLSEIYIDGERNAFQPAAAPGEIPKQRPEAYRTRIPVKTVSAGARFGHYILDLIVFYILAIGIMAGIAIATGDEAFLDASGVGNAIYVLLVFYYFFFEAVFQTTPGKLATQCVVVDEYGQKPTIGQILGRSFSRLVPFEAFSCLGDSSRGWHDKWSDTYVVRKKDLAWMLDRLAEQEGENVHIYNSMVSEQ